MLVKVRPGEKRNGRLTGPNQTFTELQGALTQARQRSEKDVDVTLVGCMRYIYADTSVWNRLYDEKADPRTFLFELAKRTVVPIIGFNVFYEVAKLFFKTVDHGVERGRQLISYLKDYVDLRTPILKENGPLLIEEAMDVTGHQRMASCFRDDEQRQLAVREIEKLCRGEITPEAKRFFENRKMAARGSRAAIKKQLDERPELKARFGKVREEDLLGFLRAAILSPAGQSLLASHLRQEFPQNSLPELGHVAQALLQCPTSYVSRAMTRADLYLIWRCATRGSLRGDLPDDTFHAVNAAYAHVFLTTETDQARIAMYAIEGVTALVLGKTEIIQSRLMRELDAAA